jgi:hypothetical protein
VQALNSPVESALRSLIVLAEWFPAALDLGRLVLIDYFLLHTESISGPNDLHPRVQTPSGELGVKRTLIKEGLQVLIRAGLVEASVSQRGIGFSATDTAGPYIHLLESAYAGELRVRAEFVHSTLGEFDDDQLSSAMRSIPGRWAEEFYSFEDGAVESRGDLL